MLTGALKVVQRTLQFVVREEVCGAGKTRLNLGRIVLRSNGLNRGIEMLPRDAPAELKRKNVGNSRH